MIRDALQSPQLMKKKEELPLTVNQFQFTGWDKNAATPASHGSLMTMLAMVERSQIKTGNHAVVVHCMYVNIVVDFLVVMKYTQCTAFYTVLQNVTVFTFCKYCIYSYILIVLVSKGMLFYIPSVMLAEDNSVLVRYYQALFSFTQDSFSLGSHHTAV